MVTCHSLVPLDEFIKSFLLILNLQQLYFNLFGNYYFLNTSITDVYNIFLNFIKRYGIRINHNRTTLTNKVKEQQQQQQMEEQLNVILLKGNGKKYSSLTILK